MKKDEVEVGKFYTYRDSTKRGEDDEECVIRVLNKERFTVQIIMPNGRDKKRVLYTSLYKI